MGDPVRDYLRSKSYAKHVVEGGLEYLLSSWEAVAASVAGREPQQYDEYLNDADGRRILSEVLTRAPPANMTAQYRERIEDADRLAMTGLVPASECIWGKSIASRRGWHRDRDWWYYHRPAAIEADEAELWPEALD